MISCFGFWSSLMSANPITARKSNTQSAAAFAIWNEPDALDSIANTLFAAAFLLFAYGAVHFVVRLPAFALREVDIKNPPAHVTHAAIESVVKRGFKGNFFTLDLNSARAEFAALPWVRSANARRVWPDRLE